MPDTLTIAPRSGHPITVPRMGYGTMRLTGPGIYGEPHKRDEAVQILKEALTHGIRFLDTADYYGEDVTNRLIAEALYPYPTDLVICTKVGATRKPDKSWPAFNSPKNLRTSIENNLRTLKIEQLQLVHLRVMPGSDMPFEKSMGAMFQMQEEGKILHLGVSNVTEDELKKALGMGPIATVENMFGHAQRITLKSPHGENRGGGEVLSVCEENDIPLIPYFTLVNALPKKDERINEIAKKHNASATQIHIAWLLHRSPLILPIPGTSSVDHFRENMGAREINLSVEDMNYLN